MTSHVLRTTSALCRLVGHLRASPAEIDRFRRRRLRAVVSHAATRVPYYQRLFAEHGLDPADIRGPEDLEAVPISTREMLLGAPLEDRIAPGLDPAKLILRRTSGSTGIPFAIQRTWLEERLLQAFRWRARLDQGLRLDDRVSSVINPHGFQVGQEPLVHRVVQAFGFMRSQSVSCLESPETQRRELEAQQPEVILGLSLALWRLTQHLSGVEHSLRPRLVLCGGELLTPGMRRSIEVVLGAPVREAYASHEFNTLAWECPDGPWMHVNDDSIVLEVLRDGQPVRPGERGEVVATGLHSYAMPFIRYRLGDLVTRGEACGCGRPLSTIGVVAGRMNDVVPLPDGRVLHPYDVIPLLTSNPQTPVRQFQIVQEDLRHVLVRVVLTEGGEAWLASTIDRLRRLLGPEVDVRVDRVEHIRLEKSGKFKVLRSLVDSPYADVESDVPGSE